MEEDIEILEKWYPNRWLKITSEVGQQFLQFTRELWCGVFGGKGAGKETRGLVSEHRRES